MKVKNNRILLPAMTVAVLVLGGGYYGTQIINKQNIFSKVSAYTSAVNPVDPSNAPDSYEIKFTDANFKRALNSVLMKTETSRNLDSPITVGEAKKMTTFWPDIPYRNFENLEGIQYFTNLETIHIAGISSLKDISAASTLTKVRTAYLSSLNISDMSAAKNWKQVRLIWIHDTHVTDFSFLSELPYAGVWGIRSNIAIKVQKGQRIFKNPFINFDGTIMPIEENENFINVDINGNPKQDGGYVKIIKPILKGNHSFNIPEKNDTLPNGNKFNLDYSISFASVEDIDVNSEEKPDIYFNFNGKRISLKEDTPLVWEKPRQDNSTINDTIIESFKKSYNPQAGGNFFTTSSPTSDITSFTTDAEEVFSNKENQINGDYLVTVKATNKYGNTTTAQFRLLTAFASREPAKKALENFEKQPDYIKNAIPANLLTEVKRTETQPLGITNDDVKNAADSLNNKIAEIVALENERKTDISNAINELKKVIEYFADFKDVINENDKILDPVAKQANLKELEKIAERYNKNTKKLEQTLDKIANLKNLNNFSKETLAQLQEVVDAASNLNISSQLKTAEAIKNSTEDLASESEILEVINELESALNGLRADKTALNSQIKDFEDSQKWLKDEVKTEADKAKEVQKADNPTFEEIKKAEEDLKSAIEKAKKAESERQKSSEDKLKEIEKIIEDNKTKKNELPAVDIENIENLISKVKDEKKRQELSEKLQEIKNSIKQKEAQIEVDKLSEAIKKRDEEIAKQHLNSPETGYLREKQNQQDSNTILVLIGLATVIFTPIIAFFAKKLKRNSKKI
jgi:viral A-type inclusion protein, putative